jgi:hypothetical protein
VTASQTEDIRVLAPSLRYQPASNICASKMPAHFSFYQALRLLEGQRWVHVMRRKIEILADALALTAASLISTSTQTVGSSDKITGVGSEQPADERLARIVTGRSFATPVVRPLEAQ